MGGLAHYPFTFSSTPTLIRRPVPLNASLGLQVKVIFADCLECCDTVHFMIRAKQQPCQTNVGPNLQRALLVINMFKLEGLRVVRFRPMSAPASSPSSRSAGVPASAEQMRNVQQHSQVRTPHSLEFNEFARLEYPLPCAEVGTVGKGNYGVQERSN